MRPSDEKDLLVITDRAVQSALAVEANYRTSRITISASPQKAARSLPRAAQGRRGSGRTFSLLRFVWTGRPVAPGRSAPLQASIKVTGRTVTAAPTPLTARGGRSKAAALAVLTAPLSSPPDRTAVTPRRAGSASPPLAPFPAQRRLPPRGERRGEAAPPRRRLGSQSRPGGHATGARPRGGRRNGTGHSAGKFVPRRAPYCPERSAPRWLRRRGSRGVHLLRGGGAGQGGAAAVAAPRGRGERGSVAPPAPLA